MLSQEYHIVFYASLQIVIKLIQHSNIYIIIDITTYKKWTKYVSMFA